jgi:surface-anchored protein
MKPAYAALLLSFVLFSSLLSAQVPYTTGHGDIGVGYDAGEQAFEPHWHLGEDVEYAPEGAVAIIPSSAASPFGLAPALGVADGTEIRIAGSSAHQPNLGFATEELDPAEWAGPITLSLTDWSGTGEFALYTTNLSGTTVVDIYLSTFNPASTFGANGFELFPGDHQHFAFGFTAPGHYELEFTWTGSHVADGVITTSGRFAFDVVPEPATTGLALLAAAALFTTRRRRS